MFQPTSPENAAAILRLEAALSQISVGDFASYSALNAIARRDVKNGARWLLVKAADNVEKTLGCAFESVRNVGIRRLPPNECPGVGLAALRKVRRAARRGKKRIERISVNSLSEADRRNVIGYAAMLGAVALVADGRRATTVAAVADVAKPIPPDRILAMFRNDNE